MTSFRLTRPRFFSVYAWWYHVLMIPVLFPLGNYYFVGARYFSEPTLFVVGTVLIASLYWTSVILLTLSVRWVINRFPDARHALPRTVVMLVTVCGLTAATGRTGLYRGVYGSASNALWCHT